MKAVKLEAPWIIDCKDLPMPEPEDGEALLRIRAAGICGSDIGAFRGTNGLVSYPRVIGHELTGEIITIPEHNPRGLKPGDRVVVDPYLYCGHCYPCTIGRTNCCTDLHVLGVHVDGGMAEYFCHPADMLVPVPDDMTDIQAALAEPLTISLHGIHSGGLKAGEYCAIIGAGPIGLAAGLAANYSKGNVSSALVGILLLVVVASAFGIFHLIFSSIHIFSRLPVIRILDNILGVFGGFVEGAVVLYLADTLLRYFVAV